MLKTIVQRYQALVSDTTLFNRVMLGNSKAQKKSYLKRQLFF
jgi:hypothetical protein